MPRPRQREITPKHCNACECITDHYIVPRSKNRNGGRGVDYQCADCIRIKSIKRIKSNTQAWVRYKGNKCIKCGLVDDICVYGFHHKDPRTKKFNLSHKCSCKLETVKEELDKTELLCSNCHRKERKNQRFSIKNTTKQTIVDYKCKKCGKITPHIIYASKKPGRGFDYHCVSCRKQNSATRYDKHRQKCFEFKGGSCKICGLRDDFCVYDFHHRHKKEFNISSNYSCSWSKLVKELKLCDMICSNCHRKLTKGVIKC